MKLLFPHRKGYSSFVHNRWRAHVVTAKNCHATKIHGSFGWIRKILDKLAEYPSVLIRFGSRAACEGTLTFQWPILSLHLQEPPLVFGPRYLFTGDFVSTFVETILNLHFARSKSVLSSTKASDAGANGKRLVDLTGNVRPPLFLASNAVSTCSPAGSAKEKLSVFDQIPNFRIYRLRMVLHNLQSQLRHHLIRSALKIRALSCLTPNCPNWKHLTGWWSLPFLPKVLSVASYVESCKRRLV